MLGDRRLLLDQQEPRNTCLVTLQQAPYGPIASRRLVASGDEPVGRETCYESLRHERIGVFLEDRSILAYPRLTPDLLVHNERFVVQTLDHGLTALASISALCLRRISSRSMIRSSHQIDAFPFGRRNHAEQAGGSAVGRVNRHVPRPVPRKTSVTGQDRTQQVTRLSGLG